jgi:hypothetical protein
MSETERVAYFDVSYDLLKALLNLPDNTEIVHVDQRHTELPGHMPRISVAGRTFRVWVKGDDFPETAVTFPGKQGGYAPRCNPRFRLKTQKVAVFRGWNLKGEK